MKSGEKMSGRKWLGMIISMTLILLFCGMKGAKISYNIIDGKRSIAIGDASEIRKALEKIAAVKYAVPVEKDVLVNVKKYIPDIAVELKYAATDNFTGQKIYDFTEAYLRYGTVEKLRRVQDILKGYGLSLKIWDGFRPVSAQFVLWDVVPNAAYVANPNTGFSQHSRGNTVDITIVNEDGTEIEMPTKFDDFSKMADRDYRDCSENATKNVLLLENLMKENGFKTYFAEWWHYIDSDSYPVEKEFEPEQ